MAYVTIRDDAMSLEQELQNAVGMLGGRVFFRTCMDRRLTVYLNSLMGQAIRSGGSVYVERDAGVMCEGSPDGSERNERANCNVSVLLSHDTCGAAATSEQAIDGKIVVPGRVRKAIVGPFTDGHCMTHDAIEAGSPEMARKCLGIESGDGKIVIAGCLKTPVPRMQNPEVKGLVITTPLRRLYTGLPGVEVNDDTKYYIHRSLSALQCSDGGELAPGIWVAVARIGVKTIRLVAQHPGETEAMTRLAASLRESPLIRERGLIVSDPVTAVDTRTIAAPQGGSRDMRGRAKA